MRYGWNDARIEQLKDGYLAGLSYGRLAQEIFGTDKARNAVAGKVNRLGFMLTPEDRHQRQVASGGHNRKRAIPRGRGRRVKNNIARDGHGQGYRISGPPLPIPVAAPPPDESFRCTLMELRLDSCRNPIGDPLTEEFRFCGAPTYMKTPTVRSSYCAHCVGFMYRPTRGLALFVPQQAAA